MNIKNRKLISQKFDKPTKQAESYSCGYYALAQCMEAKAKIKGIISIDDNIDPQVLLLKINKKEPLWSPRQFYKIPIKTDKGKLIWVNLVQKIVEYSNDKDKDDLLIIKDLIDLNCAVMVGITVMGRKTDIDGITQYTINKSNQKFSYHWVAAIDYDANFIYFSDSGTGSRTKVAAKDFDEICDKIFVINVDKVSPSFLYPVEKPEITQSFGERPEYYKQFGGQWNNGHMGVDFKTKNKKFPSGIGTNILAAHSGVAKDFASPAYGTYIEIESDVNSKVKTRYCHLSKSYISVGDYVKLGQVIGLSGNTGNSTAPHLHFELLLDNKFLDPVKYFGLLDINDIK